MGEKTDNALEGTMQTCAVPVFRNISGYVQGEWIRSHLSSLRHLPGRNTSAVWADNPSPHAEFDRNLTGSGGTVRLHFTEREGRTQTDENRTVSEVSARVIVGDQESWGHNWWEFVVYGVHFPDFGGVVLATSSER